MSITPCAPELGRDTGQYITPQEPPGSGVTTEGKTESDAGQLSVSQYLPFPPQIIGAAAVAAEPIDRRPILPSQNTIYPWQPMFLGHPVRYTHVDCCWRAFARSFSVRTNTDCCGEADRLVKTHQHVARA